MAGIIKNAKVAFQQSNKRIFISGGQGFLGSYVVKKLIQRQQQGEDLDILPFDLSKDDGILNQVLSTQEMKKLEGDRLYGDISDFSTIFNIIKEFKPTHIIHLGSLH